MTDRAFKLCFRVKSVHIKTPEYVTVCAFSCTGHTPAAVNRKGWLLYLQKILRRKKTVAKKDEERFLLMIIC